MRGYGIAKLSWAHDTSHAHQADAPWPIAVPIALFFRQSAETIGVRPQPPVHYFYRNGEYLLGITRD
jgi:hypothetical protein